jgi:hypothetical protein
MLQDREQWMTILKRLSSTKDCNARRRKRRRKFDKECSEATKKKNKAYSKITKA